MRVGEKPRQCGVLLHPTSLPGGAACGNLGDGARRFVDFLAAAGMRWWQVLPMGPTHEDLSPYNSLSAFAADSRLIALSEIEGIRGWPEGDVAATDPAALRAMLGRCLRRFKEDTGSALQQDFARFVRQQQHWLDDYALYSGLRRQFENTPWYCWPEPLRRRRRQALSEAGQALAKDVELTRFEQFLLDRQWRMLRDYAKAKGISLMGDMPFLVAHDSADVWANQHCFDLDDSGRPRGVAGVPPDYFSETGQRWGNPLFNWKVMQANGFAWWRQRAAHLADRFDLIRIDHFRGLESVWEIPGEEATAANGHWVPVPGRMLLQAVRDKLGSLPFVAEDLGIVTDAVAQLRDEFDLPGTIVLQFAFDGDGSNPYLPHNHRIHSVVYTGTHDNDTTLGWYRQLQDSSRENVHAYLGYPGEDMPWPLIRCALASVAGLAVIPWQDLLALGTDHRMNTPATLGGQNWRFRFDWQQVPGGLEDKLRDMLSRYDRCQEQR